MVDSTRKTVSRVLTYMRGKGLLRIKGVTWTVTNPEAMKTPAEWGLDVTALEKGQKYSARLREIRVLTTRPCQNAL